MLLVLKFRYQYASHRCIAIKLYIMGLMDNPKIEDLIRVLVLSTFATSCDVKRIPQISVHVQYKMVYIHQYQLARF